jgi:D-xylose transport system permease protein
VVTLAGLPGLQGLMIVLVARSGHGPGGSIPISNTIIDDLTTGNLSPAAGWIVMVVIVAVAAAILLLRDRQRRAAGLVTPPLGVTLLKIVVMVVAGVVVVLVGNANRGVGLVSLGGVPWVVLIVLGSWSSIRPCSGGPASAATSTRSAATPRRPGGPAST